MKIVYAMQQMIDKDRPYIVLSYDDQLNAWSNDWTGFVEVLARAVQQPVQGELHPGPPGLAASEREETELHRAEYVVKRLAFAVMTVFVAITINFVLFRALPGNAVADLARAPHASPQLRAALTHEFGLDQPLWKQYVLYLDQLVFHANMGVSFADSQPVTSELTDKLKNTIPMVIDRHAARDRDRHRDRASCPHGGGAASWTRSARTRRSSSTRCRRSSSG